MENFSVVCLVIIYGLCLSVGLVKKFLFFFLRGGKGQLEGFSPLKALFRHPHFCKDALSKLAIQVIACLLNANTILL